MIFTLLSVSVTINHHFLEHSAAGTTLKENTGLYTHGVVVVVGGAGAIKIATASPAILQGHVGLDSHTAEGSSPGAVPLGQTTLLTPLKGKKKNVQKIFK